MRTPSDAILVAGLRAGDRQAFRQVYERYKSDVLALLATMLGGQDDAWDLLHDVFISLAGNARKLAPKSNLKGYLLTAAANRARDFLARRIMSTVECDAEGHCPTSTAEDPAAIVARTEQADRLKQVLASLPDEQRIIVALHIYGDLTFKQIAARLALPENTAQSRYRYALEKLRRYCQGENQ